MSTAPQFVPVDQETEDILTLVADITNPVGRDAVAEFLAACEADARTHGGQVSVSRVGAALAEQGIEHHRYSSFWSRFTGKNRPMRKATPADNIPVWETRKGSTSGNNGKPFPVRIWVGDQAQAVAS